MSKIKKEIIGLIRDNELTEPMKRVLKATDRLTVNELLYHMEGRTIYFPIICAGYTYKYQDMEDLQNALESKVRTYYIAEEFSKESLHIPRITKFKKFMKRYLTENSDKTNIVNAIALGVTEETIRKHKKGF